MNKFNDLLGRRLGNWTVVRRVESMNGARWECLCDCGAVKVVHGSRLATGASRSCGCARQVIRRGSDEPVRVPSFEERFWSYVDRRSVDECWEWKAARGPRGYGTFCSGRAVPEIASGLAHRIAYVLAGGSVSKGMMVCHRCDNPPCCNPSHLFLGTLNDNVADMIQKGRQARGSMSGRATIREEQALDAWARLRTGKTISEVAEETKLRRSTVANIALGYAWNHVTGAPRRRVRVTENTPPRAAGGSHGDRSQA